MGRYGKISNTERIKHVGIPTTETISAELCSTVTPKIYGALALQARNESCFRLPHAALRAASSGPGRYKLYLML